MAPQRDGWRGRYGTADGRWRITPTRAGTRRSTAGGGRSSPPSLGRTLDGFDFYILKFILIDIRNGCTGDAAPAGALGAVTLLGPETRGRRFEAIDAAEADGEPAERV